MSKRISVLDSIIEVLLTAGLFYMLYSLIFDDREAANSQEENRFPPGLHGLPNIIRKFKGYKSSSGNYLYLKEIEGLDNKHKRIAFKLATQASYAPVLTGNFVKFFVDDEITGELIKGQVRILFYMVKPDLFISLTIFLKKDDETDKLAKQRARNRIKDIKENIGRYIS